VYLSSFAMFMLLAVIFIASLTSALTVLTLWRCFGAAGRWLVEDQSCKRATPAQKVQFSALKSIPVNAEEKVAPPRVDVDIDLMVRVFEVFVASSEIFYACAHCPQRETSTS
jgi:hypothetical protein